MRTRTLVLLILTVGILAAAVVFVFFFRQEPQDAEQNAVPPGISIPRAASGEEADAYAGGSGFQESERILPAFSLEADETFIQAVNADINGDGTYDQLCALRRTGESGIRIVCAIQNPVTTEYVRLPPAETSVTQAHTLLMYLADVTGEQKNALVYSGMNAENLQVLGIFAIEQDRNAPAQNGFSLREILRVSSDGAISVEETRRSDAYNLGLSAGESFPVISYSSVPGGAGEETGQIRRTYNWDPASGVYVLTDERQIPARNTVSAVLQRLREGGQNAFSAFLKGVWLHNSGGPRVSFDLESGEIIFLDGATEEVFRCENISVRRYGVYLVTRNSLISNIRRLIDIEITGTDELRLRATDDVRLKIGVGSVWDGAYRRMQNTTEAAAENPAERAAALLEEHTASWEDASGRFYSFAGGQLTVSGAADAGPWKYIIYLMHGQPVMQMQTESGESRFYLLLLPEGGNSGQSGAERITLREIHPSAGGFKASNVPETVLFPR